MSNLLYIPSADHNHNVALCASWRPWRGYRVHEFCTRCDREQTLPGHWWRRSEMLKRYRWRLALDREEQMRRIDASTAGPPAA
jgi:hypothetical protein